MYHFARTAQHPVTRQDLPGVAVMKVTEPRGTPPRRDEIFVSQHADLDAALAEVRRLNEKVMP